jgi:DNA repair protein RadD
MNLFPSQSAGYALRPYQAESVAAFWRFLRTQAGNPVIVLPTGAGKAVCIARLCADAIRWKGRVVVLQHRKELIQQNAEKIQALLPNFDIGVYSAGLRSRDADQDIVVGGIQSIYKHAYDLGQRHLVLIDEVHLVGQEGMYRTFLDDLRSANELVRLGGLTATPYRLDSGPICRPNALFQKVCYSANIRELIEAGYLCRLTSKPAAGTVDTRAIRLRGGEFITGEMESVFDRITAQACREIVANTADRHSVLVFCSGVQHALHVAQVLKELTGGTCGVVTGDTLPLERAALLADFRAGHLRFLINCDVLTTGFDAPNIDCIAILRATMSPGLYCQMVGRGFRISASKRDCLVLDFGGNIARHGPIDAVDYGRCRETCGVVGEAATKTCPNCGIEIYAGVRECECGFLFPVERASHVAEADESPILSEPETWIVEEVTYSVHEKKKAPDAPLTLRVDYGCRPEESSGGNLETKTISEWVCLEHPPGFARAKARKWWAARSIAPITETIEEAADLGRRGALAWPTRITTLKEGRWYRVISAELEEQPSEWLEEIQEQYFEDADIPF